MNLAGKSALVTGSTRGIGLAVAEGLLEAGAAVVITSRTREAVEETADRLGRIHEGRVEGVPCDVRDPMACQRLVEQAVEAMGGLDVLVNNAGLGVFDSITEMSTEDFQRQIETNLCGVFYCSQSAAPHLMASGDGWIINLGSLAGRNPFAGGTAYNATKFGLVGMTEAMMLDLRHEGIRVSLVMPGSVDTDFSHPAGAASRPWALQAGDVAKAVLGILDFPPHAHVSRVEMRPAKPPRR